MKKRLLIGNWKMYVTSAAEAKKFITVFKRRTRAVRGVEVWLAPSFVLLPSVSTSLKRSAIRIGAQTCSAYPNGAHTGDISAAMLKGAGATFVLVGHSERRAMGESNDTVREILQQAIQAGLSVVLCVGEQERDQSGAFFEIISEQLRSALVDFPSTALSKLTVAYEPIWAIGKSGKDAIQPDDLHEMQIFIRKVIANILSRDTTRNIPILYGGAVEPENAKALIDSSGVNGLLVGHASASAESFAAILSACKK